MVLLPSIFYVMIWNRPIEIATKLEIQVSLLAGQESKSRARENFRKMGSIACAWAPPKNFPHKNWEKNFPIQKFHRPKPSSYAKKKNGGKNRNPNPLSPVRVAVLQHMDRLSFWASFDAKVTWISTSSPAGGNDFKPRRSVTSTSDIWSRLIGFLSLHFGCTRRQHEKSKHQKTFAMWTSVDMARKKIKSAKPKKGRSHLDCDFFIGRFVVTNYTPEN